MFSYDRSPTDFAHEFQYYILYKFCAPNLILGHILTPEFLFNILT